MINAVYEGYSSCSAVAQYLVMHVYMLVPLTMLYVRHAHLGLHIGVSLKGKTTRIWSFGCGFTCATIMGYAGFELSFGIIVVL